MQTYCADECNACAANDDCLDLIDCLNYCSNAYCQQDCLDMHPSGSNDLLELLGSDSSCLGIYCSYGECSDETTSACSIQSTGHSNRVVAVLMALVAAAATIRRKRAR